MTEAEPSGVDRLNDPYMNRGTSFTNEERDEWGLHGLLPAAVETMQHRADRVVAETETCQSDLARYLLLAGVLERDERLYYLALQQNLERFMPIVYTPVVGQACAEYGHILGRARGMYLPITLKGRLREVLRNWPRPDAHFIVVTDGSRILGLGDLGANGMGIPVGKLALYTAVAGVPPWFALPITLDVGCDNPEIRDDPYYSGLRQPRVPEDEYLEFLDEFVAAVQDVFDDSCIQFEDFNFKHADLLLNRYRDQVCCFNDDIQGTAATAVAGLCAASQAKGESISEQRVLFLGAGSAGCGIADLVVQAMVAEGATSEQARHQVRMFDEHGLLTRSRTDLAPFQVPFAARAEDTDSFVQAIQDFQPTAIVGVSTVAGLFTTEVLETMAAINERPVIFPFSNPTSHSECTAEEAYAATEGRCLFASGSPFPSLEVAGRTISPAQGNNVYIFPALGLAIMATRADRVTDEMFLCAARALADQVSSEEMAAGLLYPARSRIREVSAAVATEVAELIFQRGLARVDRPDGVAELVAERMWDPSA